MRSGRTTPYYEDDWCVIYHGDSRELLEMGARADAVVTDPPYGNGTTYDGYEDTQDNLKMLVADIMRPCVDLLSVVAVTSGVANVPLYPPADWMLAWFYQGGPTTGRWGFSTWQPVLVYGKDPYLAAGKGRYPDSMKTQRGKPDVAGHPCPKPLSLMRWIVSRVTLEGHTVFDPFMGSGATLAAAKATGRKAIGIEQSEWYCEIAAKRLTQEVLPLGA